MNPLQRIGAGIQTAITSVAKAVGLSPGAQATRQAVQNPTMPSASDVKKSVSEQNAKTMQNAIDKTEAKQKRAEGFANADKQWKQQVNEKHGGVDPYAKEESVGSVSQDKRLAEEKQKAFDKMYNFKENEGVSEYEEGIKLDNIETKPKKTSGEG